MAAAHYNALAELAKAQNIYIMMVNDHHILAFNLTLHTYFVQEYHHVNDEYSLDYTEPTLYDSVEPAVQRISALDQL